VRGIVNSSPLILLTKVRHLDLLKLGAMDIIVPDVVIAEIQAKGPHDSTVQTIGRANWLTVGSTPPTPEPVRKCKIDPGESAVLSLAHGDPACEVVLDDMAGRRCAARLNIPCVGTLGLVLTAKRLGVISAAKPVVVQLRLAGLYLDDRFVDEVLRREGE
jgi:predicted nucleic acid-binding protein